MFVTVDIHHMGWGLDLFAGCSPEHYTCFGWYLTRIGHNKGVTLTIALVHHMEWEMDHYG